MENDRNAKHSHLFFALVASLEYSALMGLGKLVNPLTGKAQRDLPAASEAIDMLDMLEARTRGHLSPEEAGRLSETLHLLRLNYVEEYHRPEPPPPEPEPEAPTEPPPATPPE
ncbi:MAG: DUF1844 domain-containing protein [Candidatus Zixiibacteriota bacterium]|nr:MAG: DUF1844 domain-containing protein [candidate division Zixibacteria bacterium]